MVERPPRLRIECVAPSVCCGRYAVKATAGDVIELDAVVLRDGKEAIQVHAEVMRPRGDDLTVALEHGGDDHYRGPLRLDAPGRWSFAIHAEDEAGDAVRSASRSIEVDVPLARFGSWYELFPRSWGGLAGVERALPELARLGFDVVYLTPIHPIGHTNRKGRNNALAAAPGDPGSPWAIGSAQGGHDAIEPGLGTLEDFARLVEAARQLRIEIALDLALQCSLDHPWLAEHPEWFVRRPDGTIPYAENPPKRYEDVVSLDWATPGWRALWDEVLRIVLTWVERGVRVFRVDNPHTKPFALWEWLIAEVRRHHPEVFFLAEAFTRPERMRALAALGFAQSYTYFTWRTSRAELSDYVRELADETADYLRPNFFANTPDILHRSLQEGGRPAFEIRLVLAATLAPSYGIYSGFEWCENVPVASGSEEYLDSEKYELKQRALDGPLLGLVERLNALRRRHPALQHLPGVRFLETHADEPLAYVRHHGDDVLLCVVNLDPHAPREGLVEVPDEIGLPQRFDVDDALSGQRFAWQRGGNYVRLDPALAVAHVLEVRA